MSKSHRIKRAIKHYFYKWSGEEKGGPGVHAGWLFVLITALGGFAAVGIMTAVAVLTENEPQEWLIIVGSFGATMVLVFGAPSGPFSQPRNVIFGNIIASLVGVGCREWIGKPMGNIGLALPLSVVLSYILMQATRSVNPPAGGTAAIAVISSPSIDKLGWGLIVPSFLWSVVFVFIACVFINLIPDQRYPKYWFVEKKTYKKIALCQKKQSVSQSTPTASEKSEEEPQEPVEDVDLEVQSHHPMRRESSAGAGEEEWFPESEPVIDVEDGDNDIESMYARREPYTGTSEQEWAPASEPVIIGSNDQVPGSSRPPCQDLVVE